MDANEPSPNMHTQRVATHEDDDDAGTENTEEMEETTTSNADEPAASEDAELTQLGHTELVGW